ncbi:hypothetical protein PNOK_0109900 [Pyrrhoderma noxium]|uniref:Mitochondrial outer membrane transport complex Sam37/metaxin N-terminal domain-containing protein n=1 Tax=Pyrrhoderma noxium TaxID=2282107 RepID=A0A286UWV0_9AGAM|nr:hypothetical protein PNOK_0109900 [Pyrrhoderma noxium]
MTSSPELVLHVWPSRWDLPTFTAECLASVIYLQLAIPGEFVVEESINPDLSPNGQLPYLSHGEVYIASYSSIVKYVSGLHKPTATRDQDQNEDDSDNQMPSLSDLSAHLNRVQQSQQVAWLEYVFSNLGDLVACSVFTLRHNYYESSRKSLAELFPVPQRYYIPDRLRESYRTRLEAAGLWSISAEEAEEEKREKKAQRGTSLAHDSVIQEAFGREKVLDKARTSLDLLNSLLGNKHFFFGEKISTIDVSVAAHILLLTEPQLPNTLLRDLVVESYPTLYKHAKFLFSFSLPASDSAMEHLFTGTTLYANKSDSIIFPSIKPLPRRRPTNRNSGKQRSEKSEEEKEFDRMRWAWLGMSVLGVFTWMWYMGIRIELRPKGGGDEDDEDDEEEEEPESEEESDEEGEE